VTLSPAEPIATVDVHVDEGADILTLDLDPSVPSGQAFLIEVTATTSFGETIRLGSIAPFPADRPGRYMLPLGPLGARSQATAIAVGLHLLPVRMTDALDSATTVLISVGAGR
jgi:hypothetical protein